MTQTDKTQIEQTIAVLIAQLPGSLKEIYDLTLPTVGEKLNASLCLEEMKNYIADVERFVQQDVLAARLVLKLTLLFNPEQEEKIIGLTNSQNFVDLQVNLQRNAAVVLAQNLTTEERRATLRELLSAMAAEERDVDLLDCATFAGPEYIEPYLNDSTAEKYSQYFKECIRCSVPAERVSTEFKRLIDCLVRRECYFIAAHTAIEAGAFDVLSLIFEKLTTQSQRLEFALLIAEYQESVHFDLPEEYANLLNNHVEASFFREAASRLGLLTPKSVDEVLKREDIQIEWAKCQNYVADFIQNGFMNAGFGTDLMINSNATDDVVFESVNQSQFGTQGAEIITRVGANKTQLPEGYELLIKQVNGQIETGKCDISTAVAVASVGLLHLWNGYQNGFDQILKLMNSSDKYVRSGAVLALGIAAHGTRPEGFDFLLKLVGPVFNPYYYEDLNNVVVPANSQAINREEETTPTDVEQQEPSNQAASASGASSAFQAVPPNTAPGQNAGQTEQALSPAAYTCEFTDRQFPPLSKNEAVQEWANSKEAFAALSLGIAYMMTNNSAVKELIIHRLHSSSDELNSAIPPLEKNPRSYACLALGLISMGSCDLDAANVILRLIAGNSRSERLLRFFPLCCIAIGLIFFEGSKTPEKAKRVEEFSDRIMATLSTVTRPDQVNEHMAVTCQEDNVQLAAYLQALVTIFAYAGCSDERVYQQTLWALSQVLLGRVAAEEAIEILKFDKTAQFKKNRNKEDLNQITAETGQPLMIPTSDRLVWPGDNMDPMTVICVGLGAVCGPGSFGGPGGVAILRIAEEILEYADIHAKRAVPFLLVFAGAGNTAQFSEILQQLERLALHSDATISANAILALGLVGAGSMSAQAAAVLRRLLESKYYSEANIEFVTLNAQLAFGLLYAGRGALEIDLRRPKTLGALLALMLFAAPAASVMTRPKCCMSYYLLSACLTPKFKYYINTNLEFCDVTVRVGKAVEDFQAPRGFKLTGFSLHTAPVVCGVDQRAVLVEGGKELCSVGACVVVEPENAETAAEAPNDGLYS